MESFNTSMIVVQTSGAISVIDCFYIYINMINSYEFPEDKHLILTTKPCSYYLVETRRS